MLLLQTKPFPFDYPHCSGNHNRPCCFGIEKNVRIFMFVALVLNINGDVSDLKILFSHS